MIIDINNIKPFIVNISNITFFILIDMNKLINDNLNRLGFKQLKKVQN